MRFPYPPNFEWEDVVRFTVPTLSFAVKMHGDAVEVPDDAPQEEIDTLMAALEAYDRATPTMEEADVAAFLLRLRASQLEGKTPERVYLFVQAEIEAITTLAEAKAFLLKALPVMAAGIVALWRHRE